MEIKVRGPKVYLLRSVPDPSHRGDVKRSKQVTVAKVPVANLGSLDLALLTVEGEPKKWADWVAARQAELEQARQQAERDRLAGLPVLLAAFRDRLAAAPELADQHAQEWLQAIQETEAAIHAVVKARKAPGLLSRLTAAVKG